MRIKFSLGVLFAVTVLSILLAAPQDSRANGAVALTGQVSSQKEGLMEGDRKSTRLNSSHIQKSRMPSSA